MALNIEQHNAIHASARLLSPDETLMARSKEVAEFIYAHYPEAAHELLATMVAHDVFQFLLAISFERDQERNTSLRSAA